MSGASARAAVEGGVVAVQAAVASGDTDTGFMLLDALVREWPASARVRLLAAALHAEEGFGDVAREHGAAAVASARGDLAAYSSMLALLKLGEPIDPHTFADAHSSYGRYVESMRTYRNPGHARVPVRLLVAGLDAHIALVRFLPSIIEHVPAGVTPAVASLDGALLESCRRRWPGIATLLLPPDPRAQIAVALEFAPDILLDLAGHSPNNVLHLLASRCAPVQVTWLDYLATTGLEAVDGRITDGISDPPGNEQFHAESLWRLPVPPWSYEPWPEFAAIDVGTPSGPPRLGCASVPAKLNARSLALFARVLADTPGATLTLAGFRSRRAVERARAFFLPELAARVEFLPRLPVARYLEMLAGLDVVLDTVGFSGGTSTLDALWHGVPVVTQPLVLSHTRSSASMLAHLGQHELVASDDASYAAAVHRALDSDRANPARRRERHELLRGSALGDGRRFAAAFYATLLGRASG